MKTVELLGFIAGALGLLYSVPQVLRLYRSEETVGVSAATWILMMFGHSLWTGYGVAENSPSQFVTNVIAGCFVIVLLLKLLGISWVSLLVLAFPLTTVPFLLMWKGPPVLGFLLLLAVTVSARIPQAVRSLRTFKTGSGSVVSVTTWAVAFTASGLWLLYAVIDQRLIIVLATSISMTMALLIVVFELLARRRTVVSSSSTDIDNRLHL